MNMGILKSSFTGGQWTPQESNPCYPSCQRNAMRSTSNDYKRCYTVANLQEQACLTNQQGRARNERAMSCLTRQQENKQKGKQEEKQGRARRPIPYCGTMHQLSLCLAHQSPYFSNKASSVGSTGEANHLQYVAGTLRSTTVRTLPS